MSLALVGPAQAMPPPPAAQSKKPPAKNVSAPKTPGTHETVVHGSSAATHLERGSPPPAVEQAPVHEGSGEQTTGRVKNAAALLNGAKKGDQKSASSAERFFTAEAGEKYSEAADRQTQRAQQKDSANWRPSRRELHGRLLKDALKRADTFARALSGLVPPTLFAMRGNTAAGKTSALKKAAPAVKEALDAVEHETASAPWGVSVESASLNPDNFKGPLMKAGGRDLTSAEVHLESSVLTDQLEKELINLKDPNDKTKPATILVDKRLAKLKEVKAYADAARESGRDFMLCDVDAPLEASLVGVLRREPGGPDPLPSFDVVKEGFEAVREDRAAVIKLFQSGEATGTYKLYVADHTGDRVHVATVEGKELKIEPEREELFKEAMRPADHTTADKGNEKLTLQKIDALVAKLEPTQRDKVRGQLRKYVDKTWKEALDAHAEERRAF
jgi:hypothetical protein